MSRSPIFYDMSRFDLAKNRGPLPEALLYAERLSLGGGKVFVIHHPDGYSVERAGMPELDANGGHCAAIFHGGEQIYSH